ncbi:MULTISPECIES: DNA gyrase inhibitor YacG [unclassified Sphingomonas]|uniref:DNA gyrase inhibitor YacG n=1 Tax=unclassified Sphingomonas TaxID=196159 RepID=UPI0022B510C8|nr:DNA gyrase inhibitor YacG [Sphingomonas sp. NIBR02145]WHU02289.1 DNA gyrase inhibitor YacG [Sphingomonas sp. NIBR02145]
MSRNKGCPVCGQQVVIEHAPFCSKGCKDRDLLQWLGEGYRIPAEPAPRDVNSGVDSPDSPD